MQWNLKTLFKSFHLIQTWCHINVYPNSDADLVTFTSYYSKQGVYVLNFFNNYLQGTCGYTCQQSNSFLLDGEYFLHLLQML